MATTLKEVAAVARVSPATAARALGSYGYVSAEARRRVLDAAEQLGYRPNGVARALVQGTTQTIGLVVGDIQNPFFGAMARGVSDVLEEEGYTVLLANSDESLVRERSAVTALRRRSVDGFIVTPVGPSDGAHLRGLQGDAEPLVLVDRFVRGLQTDVVKVDNVTGAARAVRHLLGFGYGEVGVVADLPDTSPVAERLQGHRRAMRQAGLEPREDLIAVGPPTMEGALDAARRLLGRPDRPRAVFTTSNFMTAGVVRIAREMGLRMPRDVALVGFDDLEWTTLVDPPITVVAQPVAEMGRSAGRRLLARMAGDTSPPQLTRLHTELIVRRSCGAGDAEA